MLCLLLALVTLQAPFAQKVHDAYAQQDAEALRTLLDRANSPADSLLVRYRLYPLSENAALLDDLPEKLDDGSAREWALLSGLWSYRAGEAAIFGAITYGRRSADLLETAQSLDPDDPYVLLVEGQSLLFRPAIAGKDPTAAARQFAALVEQAQSGTAGGISEMEAQVWRWLALKEAGRTQDARSLHDALRTRAPAPLYQQFLDDPPDV